jgi:putative hydrolase of the HAD superfamily
MAARYSTVFFDLYGTLIDINNNEEEDRTWEGLRSFLGHHGVEYSSPRELRTVFRREEKRLQDRHVEQLEERGIEVFPDWVETDVAPVFQYICQLKGVDTAADSDLVKQAAWEFRKASTRHFALFDGALDLIADLRKAHISPVLFSNAQSLYTRPELEKTGLDTAFDHIFISSEEGWKKPSPYFYALALRKLGISPAHTLMVGNEISNDVCGAVLSGLDSVYLQTGTWEGNDQFPAPDAIRSFHGADYRAVFQFATGYDRDE